jgi:hypothetical protein
VLQDFIAIEHIMSYQQADHLPKYALVVDYQLFVEC